MHYYEVAPNVIVRSGSDSFTYSSDFPLPAGQIVEIEVGKRHHIGVVTSQSAKPPYPTKPITRQLSYTLPSQLVDLAQWISSYYTTPLATVLQTMLPRGLTKTRRPKESALRPPSRDRINFVFNKAQAAAIKTILEMSPGSALLHGITGSGKTRIYLETAKAIIKSGKSVIVLVPEIALTSQLVDEFTHDFPNQIILTHSKQTEAQRHLVWQQVLQSQDPKIIVGPRSALFMPVSTLGLIIIDECHEPSFKQEQSPRYSALRTASMLASYHQAKLVLGSATPNIADYYLAEHSGRPIITLSTSARANAVKPTVQLVDMTKRTNFARHRFLSSPLIECLTSTLETGHQALLFHNRRGSASTTLCENCGWSAGCSRCFVPLTLHADHHELRCHICGLTARVPTSCPSCQHTDIIHKGIGTKLIEAEVKKLFPNKNIARFDGDTQSGHTVEEKYAELYNGTIDIIIGTQVIAKGLDLPLLRTVGVIQADSGLSLPDYSSSERTFQLLAQVIGRVGRSHHPTNVIVQSYQPTHPAVVDGLAQDYTHFYNTALAVRKQSNFPPFSHLLKLTCIYKTEAAAIRNAKALATTLRTHIHHDVQILGPTPAFYERQHETYRWQLTLKSPSRAHLVDTLQHLPSSHWQFELDPSSLL